MKSKYFEIRAIETLSIKNLMVGDIIAVKGHTWLARQIRKFMKIQSRIKYHTDLKEYYNHTMIVTNPKTLEVAEAIGKGYVINPIFKETNLKNMILFRPRTQLDSEEKFMIKKTAINLAKKNIEYEILNFFWWIPYILTNGKIDLSPKASKKANKVFCFEASAMIFNSARNFFTHPDKTTTVDMQMDERLIQYKFNIN